MSDAASPPAVVSAPATHALAWGTLTAVAAALAVLIPAIALVLVVAVAIVAWLWRRPVPVAGRHLTGMLVVAAIAGPNLAVPQAPQLFGFRVMLALLLVAVMAHLAIGGHVVWPRVLTLPASLLGVWLAWSLASLAWADLPLQVLRWTGLLAMGAVLALMIPVAFNTRERVVALLKILAGTFVAVVAVSLMELKLGIRLPTSRLLEKPTDTAFAATSFFGNENNLATYLTLTLPYFLALPIVFRDIRLRALGVAGSASTLLLLLYTGSKTNLVATALVVLTLFVVLVIDPASRRRALVGAGVAAIGSALILVPAINGVGPIKLPARALSKFSFSLLSDQVQEGVGSGAVRSDLLSDGIGFVRSSGGLGLGAGNADAAVSALPNFPGVENLHNWWLEVAVNGGLIGFALYCTFYAFLVSRQLRGARHADPFVQLLGLAGAAALVGFAMGCLAPSSVLGFAPMWIAFGLCLITPVLAARASGGEETT